MCLQIVSTTRSGGVPRRGYTAEDANAEDDPEAQCGNMASHAPVPHAHVDGQPARWATSLRSPSPVRGTQSRLAALTLDYLQPADLPVFVHLTAQGRRAPFGCILSRRRRGPRRPSRARSFADVAAAAFEAGRRYGRRETRRRCTTRGRRSSSPAPAASAPTASVAAAARARRSIAASPYCFPAARVARAANCAELRARPHRPVPPAASAPAALQRRRRPLL
ncbi:hypothetical protein B0H15DRAFT_547541 [Mycena belliarum]|uniref:Uncharacterized protein n=1 Tax=Mycena belliarum TaxID=1033014 RepID=A0AAD6XS58_9AGAR|nr:hypothetical protein B0H15DRAFT_547541 [Mycena belliae]